MTVAREQRPHPDARFWNRIARRYAAKPVSDLAAYETKLDYTDARLSPHHRVLEVGCGTGSTAIHHARKVRSMLACDISANMIELAADKARAQQITNIEFLVSSIAELDRPPASFDVVLAHSVLHLVDDVVAALTKLHSLLVPNGLLISSTACVGDMMPLFGYVAPIGRILRLLPRVNVFREQALMRWLDETGFEVEQRWQAKPKSSVYIIARKRCSTTDPASGD